jgi:hypothetical protein
MDSIVELVAAAAMLFPEIDVFVDSGGAEATIGQSSMDGGRNSK